MTQAAEELLVLQVYSDVKYEALLYDLVLHPEVWVARLGCSLVLAAGIWVKEVLCGY